jgi:hypothetical protein
MSSATQVRPMVPVLPGISGATRTIFMSGCRAPRPDGSGMWTQAAAKPQGAARCKRRPWAREGVQERRAILCRQRASRRSFRPSPLSSHGPFGRRRMHPRPQVRDCPAGNTMGPGFPGRGRAERPDPPHQTRLRKAQKQTPHLLPAVADQRRESVQEHHLPRRPKCEIVHRGMKPDPLRPLRDARPEAADRQRHLFKGAQRNGCFGRGQLIRQKRRGRKRLLHHNRTQARVFVEQNQLRFGHDEARALQTLQVGRVAACERFQHFRVAATRYGLSILPTSGPSAGRNGMLNRPMRPSPPVWFGGPCAASAARTCPLNSLMHACPRCHPVASARRASPFWIGRSSSADPIESFHRLRYPNSATTPMISTIASGGQWALSRSPTSGVTALGTAVAACAKASAAFSASVKCALSSKSKTSFEPLLGRAEPFGGKDHVRLAVEAPRREARHIAEQALELRRDGAVIGHYRDVEISESPRDRGAMRHGSNGVRDHAERPLEELHMLPQVGIHPVLGQWVDQSHATSSPGQRPTKAARRDAMAQRPARPVSDSLTMATQDSSDALPGGHNFSNARLGPRGIRQPFSQDIGPERAVSAALCGSRSQPGHGPSKRGPSSFR